MTQRVDFADLRQRLQLMAERFSRAIEPGGERRARELAERARLLARESTDDQEQAQRYEWLRARSGDRHFAWPLSELEAVIACPRVIPVPASLRGQRGLISHRGRFWAAVEAPAAARTDGGYALLLRAEVSVAVVCDEVLGIVALAQAGAGDGDAGQLTVTLDGQAVRLCSAKDSFPTTQAGRSQDVDNQ